MPVFYQIFCNSNSSLLLLTSKPWTNAFPGCHLIFKLLFQILKYPLPFWSSTRKTTPTLPFENPCQPTIVSLGSQPFFEASKIPCKTWSNFFKCLDYTAMGLEMIYQISNKIVISDKILTRETV